MKRVALILAFMLLPVRALAQPASEGQALRAEIERDFVEAQAADCAIACRALASMRRAADRLCAIDPGDACTEAQAKVKRSTERVRAACPECASAASETDASRAAVAPRSPSPAAPTAEEIPAVERVSAPRRGGGCGGCAASGRSGELPAAFALALALVAFVRGRKRLRNGTCTNRKVA